MLANCYLLVNMPSDRIVFHPAKILSTPTKHVQEFDEHLKLLVTELIEVMIDAPGIGVAANQIGADRSVAVIGIPSNKQPLVMVNPKILKSSRPMQVDEEGCLSLPGYWGRPMRSERVRVEYYDVGGNRNRIDATDYLAQVVQHEIDHLNGIIYPQRLLEGDSLSAVRPMNEDTDSN